MPQFESHRKIRYKLKVENDVRGEVGLESLIKSSVMAALSKYPYFIHTDNEIQYEDGNFSGKFLVQDSPESWLKFSIYKMSPSV